MHRKHQRTHVTDSPLKQANRRLTRQLWVFAFGFFVFGFALVPLYSVLCEITGYGDRTQLGKASALRRRSQ